MKYSPAGYVIHVFGGVRATGRAIGRSGTAVCKWTKPIKDKGTSGRIPGKCQAKILAVASKLNLDITPEDLIYGRVVKG